MLYIDTTKASADLYIPRNGWWVSGRAGLHLLLKNTTTGEQVECPIDEARPFGFTVFLAVQLPAGFYAGEWQYTLQLGFDTVAFGLVTGVDGGKAAVVQYEHENKAIQYNG